MPPLLERNRKRFSEIRLSSSNRPNLTLNHGEFFRLSKRIKALSKCHTAVGSDDGSSTNEMFLYNVPADHKSIPERSKPDWVTFPATLRQGFARLVPKHPSGASIT